MCAELNFLAVTNQKGLSGMQADGIVGMSPLGRTNGKLFVGSLYADNAIEQNVFAFKIGRGQEKSQVEIGGYNLTENSLAGSPLMWHQLINTNYWSIPMVNPQINGVALKTTAKTAIVDTGSSYAVVPPSDYKQIMLEVTAVSGIQFNGQGVGWCRQNQY